MLIRVIRGLFFLFFITSCSQAQEQFFYLGLNSENPLEAVSHYERALLSRNVFVRRAAAEELASLMAKGTSIQPRTIQRMRNEISGPWAKALESVNFRNRNDVNKEKPLSFLLNLDQHIPEEARDYVLRTSRREFNIRFSLQELAAIEGHFFITRLRYNEALSSFRNFQINGEWPQTIPDIFIKYPVLINDLGRALQFTASGLEGRDLFLKWEEDLNAGDDVKFRLKFFASRISRRNGRNAESLELFEQCLHIAPNEEQIDACIWYILDLAAREDADLFLEKLEQFVSMWHHKNYFNDILERFLQTLSANKDWDRIIQAFYIIKETDTSIKSGYAWIISRVIEEGFRVTQPLQEKEVYQLAAYNAVGNDLRSMLYYHGLSAASLEKPFFPSHLIEQEDANSRQRRSARGQNSSQAIEFAEGFYVHGTESHALRFIRGFENEFSINELRVIAGFLENDGQYAHVIRLVSRYMNRDDFTTPIRRDLELLFPVPYKDLVDKYAKEHNIPPDVLFGLIRTESAFQPAVVSHAGAVGLTQLIPDTAIEMAGRIKREGGPDFTGDNFNLDDPEQNIYIGTYYLKYLLSRFDDNMLLSLMAYNGGMNRIRRLRGQSSLPADLFMETVSISETRDYGRKVLGAAEMYKVLYY